MKVAWSLFSLVDRYRALQAISSRRAAPSAFFGAGVVVALASVLFALAMIAFCNI